jgi:hypothetical protein
VPAASPDGSVTDIGSEVGVVSAAVSTESQFPPEAVVALSVNVTADPSLVLTITLCDETVPPTVALKVRSIELRLSVGGPAVGIGVVTVMVTGTDNGLFEAPVEANETLPVYVPTSRPVATMCTVSVKGVLPPGCIMVSQLPPAGVVEELAVTAIGEPPLVTKIVWSAGAVPFTVKLSDGGVAPSVVGGTVLGAVIR